MDNNSNNIEDIFDKVDKTAPRADTRAPLRATSMPGPLETGGASTVPGMKKRILIVVGVLVLAAVIIIGFFLYLQYRSNPGNDAFIPEQEEEKNPVDNNANNSPDENKAVVEDTTALDSDNDGLSDIDESKHNTNPNKSDTDNDGLNDGDEVRWYKTDPLNPDSDGDGYLDGEEVKGGYNPLGAGKLLNFDKALEELKNKK